MTTIVDRLRRVAEQSGEGASVSLFTEAADALVAAQDALVSVSRTLNDCDCDDLEDIDVLNDRALATADTALNQIYGIIEP